jgi:hypothetical protein
VNMPQCCVICTLRILFKFHELCSVECCMVQTHAVDIPICSCDSFTHKSCIIHGRFILYVEDFCSM